MTVNGLAAAGLALGVASWRGVGALVPPVFEPKARTYPASSVPKTMPPVTSGLPLGMPSVGSAHVTDPSATLMAAISLGDSADT